MDYSIQMNGNELSGSQWTTLSRRMMMNKVVFNGLLYPDE